MIHYLSSKGHHYDLLYRNSPKSKLYLFFFNVNSFVWIPRAATRFASCQQIDSQLQFFSQTHVICLFYFVRIPQHGYLMFSKRTIRFFSYKSNYFSSFGFYTVTKQNKKETHKTNTEKKTFFLFLPQILKKLLAETHPYEVIIFLVIKIPLVVAESH